MKPTAILCTLVCICLLVGCAREQSESIYQTEQTEAALELSLKTPLTVDVRIDKEDERYEYLKGYSVLKLGHVSLSASDMRRKMT